MNALPKIDIHLHLTLEQIPKNESFFISSAENMLPHLTKLGIEKGIVMASFEKQSQLMPFGSNEEVFAICNKFKGTLFPFCNIDCTDKESIFERLKSYKQKGAIGIGEIVHNRRMNDEFIVEIFSSAEKLALPVLFHLTPELGKGYGLADDFALPLLEQSLINFPNLKIIGHSQPFWHEISGDAKSDYESRNSWGSGEVVTGGRLPYLFDKYKNLYGDLSANSGGCAIMRDEVFGLDFLEKYSERLMFGTDMLNVEMEFPLAKWLDKKYLAGELSENAYSNICKNTAKKIFDI